MGLIQDPPSLAGDILHGPPQIEGIKPKLLERIVVFFYRMYGLVRKPSNELARKPNALRCTLKSRIGRRRLAIREKKARRF